MSMEPRSSTATRRRARATPTSPAFPRKSRSPPSPARSASTGTRRPPRSSCRCRAERPDRALSRSTSTCRRRAAAGASPVPTWATLAGLAGPEPIGQAPHTGLPVGAIAWVTASWRGVGNPVAPGCRPADDPVNESARGVGFPMTYPPQQPDPYAAPRRRPGPYGQQPPPRPYPSYGQPPQPPLPPPPPPTRQFEPFNDQPGYAGADPAEPPPPPPRAPKPSGPGKIIAIVVVAVLLLGGAGAGVWFLTKGDKGQNSASSDNKTSNPAPGGQDDSGGTTTAAGSADPAAVQRAYIQAYQTKQFAPVLNAACDAYKKKFGTGTAELDKQLAPYDRITAEADGLPEVTGNSATAKINLE